ncbi:DUF4381 domain-containing protein [Kangiella sp. HZ709]|uniref:DUF4381 domain-containing protein n=1 Tax=Kangiella sp. HZ709 TaxID=2666328 RepID=UPI0012B12A4A|nr:DUF4381 domain-containing protein [Kangiella sp. HZ709]MRX28510.1 DUF4381 family protein [Kangiella sp. HZ709]
MAQQELLSKLKDVHLPAEVSWWPLAIGWWLLIGSLLLSLTVLLVIRLQKAKKFRLSKLAIKELNIIASSHSDNWLMQLEVLLKRASLAYFPKPKVASLTQESWINFLISTGKDVWNDQSLMLLKDGVFQDKKAIPTSHKNQLLSEAKQWLLQLPLETNNV